MIVFGDSGHGKGVLNVLEHRSPLFLSANKSVASTIYGNTSCKWCTTGTGFVVIKDMPDYAIEVVNPVRSIKVNNSINE